MILLKIPIFYNPVTGSTKYLIFKKRYRYHKPIISLGCDCHPAYVLQGLHIRKQSLPFDWLNTDPLKGLAYVIDNIEKEFKDFLSELERNDEGYVISAKYPFAEFMHEKNLVENDADRQKFRRRIRRFQELIQAQAIFLYSITSGSLSDSNRVTEFNESVLQFEKAMKRGQMLCIYIRYDENTEEYRPHCDELFELLKKRKQVIVSRYVTEKQKYGLWGNPKCYPDLFRELGIKLKLSFPAIFIK